MIMKIILRQSLLLWEYVTINIFQALIIVFKSTINDVIFKVYNR